MSEGISQPILTDAEWQLVIELLEEERRELPIEIRHTDSRAYRDQLHQRLDAIDSILERLKPLKVS